MKNKDLLFVLLGVSGLLVVKYVVVGLCQWNSLFFPGQASDSSSRFFYPLLGVIHPTTCDQVTTAISY